MSEKQNDDRLSELADRLWDRIEDMDEDTCMGILLDVEHPEDTEEMFYYLEHGEDVTKQNLILFGLWLYNRRYHPERNLAGNDTW